MKTYSPELIIFPVLPEKEDETKPETVVELIDEKGYFKKMHCFVFGPGLGRDPKTFESVEKIIEKLIDLKKTFVLDGDALFLVTQKPEIIKGYTNAVLTPNKMEFIRLEQKLLTQEEQNFESEKKLNLLCSKLGNVTIVQKGEHDLIANGKDEILICKQEGSNRRCGGQGDILAGTLGLFIHWAQWTKQGDLFLACFAACTLVRHSAKLAFLENKRGTTTPDIISKIPKAFNELFDS
jgi:ATP-dependent NAD(P)H-hydrate dehydratase